MKEISIAPCLVDNIDLVTENLTKKCPLHFHKLLLKHDEGVPSKLLCPSPSWGMSSKTVFGVLAGGGVSSCTDTWLYMRCNRYVRTLGWHQMLTQGWMPLQGDGISFLPRARSSTHGKGGVTHVSKDNVREIGYHQANCIVFLPK